MSKMLVVEVEVCEALTLVLGGELGSSSTADRGHEISPAPKVTFSQVVRG